MTASNFFSSTVTVLFPTSLIAVFTLIASVQSQSASLDDFDIANSLAKECRPLDRALDLLFILDGSGSVGGNTWDIQMDMMDRIVEQIEVGPNKTRVAVIQYSSWTKLEFDFTVHKTKEDLKEAVKKIRYLSGTTKTGRALLKAIDTFQSERGARTNKLDVAKVIVLVSDGYSQDDAITPAETLRKRGVEILALGISSYIAHDELVKLTGHRDKVFLNDSIGNFINAFRKIAIGELCTFVKEPRGAEVTCSDTAMKVDVLTKLPFEGHLYVQGHYLRPGCSVEGDGVVNRVALTIPLDNCGMQYQFSLNPRGVLFESKALLKFRSHLSSKVDHTFQVRCFYPHSSHVFAKELPNENDEYDLQSSSAVSESKPLPASFPAWTMGAPCRYTLRAGAPEENGCLLRYTTVGDLFTHKWECDENTIGAHHSMMIHSCYLGDAKGQELLIIDESGCSLDESIVKTPRYLPESPLAVFASGTVAKFADRPFLQFRCSVHLCSRLDGECADYLPLHCPTERAAAASRAKRQAALLRRDQFISQLRQEGKLVEAKRLQEFLDPSQGPDALLPVTARTEATTTVASETTEAETETTIDVPEPAPTNLTLVPGPWEFLEWLNGTFAHNGAPGLFVGGDEIEILAAGVKLPPADTNKTKSGERNIVNIAPKNDTNLESVEGQLVSIEEFSLVQNKSEKPVVIDFNEDPLQLAVENPEVQPEIVELIAAVPNAVLPGLSESLAARIDWENLSLLSTLLTVNDLPDLTGLLETDDQHNYCDKVSNFRR